MSDGTVHLMDFVARHGSSVCHLGENNSELHIQEPGTLQLAARAALFHPDRNDLEVEAIVNGYPVAARKVPSDGNERYITFDVPIKQSCWVALRTFPHAHTNPILVIVKDQPMTADRRSAEWMLAGVEQCWKQKQRSYDTDEQADARAAYDHARKVYRQLIERTR